MSVAPRAAGGLPVRTRKLVHIYRSEGQDVAALSGVDLDVGAGEVVGLLGPSGAGKSTLLSLLAGLFRPSAGRILVGDLDVGELAGAELDRYFACTTSLLLQGPDRNLIASRTAEENVTYAQQPARRLGHPVEEPAAILDALGLGRRRSATVQGLDAADRQLTAIAAAMAPSPQVLLADEPTSQLDAADRARVLGALTDLSRSRGTTTIVVTHDPWVAGALPRTVTIRDGKIGGEGRLGAEYAVVTADHYLPIPARLYDRFPPGTLVHFDDSDGPVRLVEEEE